MIENLKQWARSIKRDAHALHLAACHPQTLWYAKGLAIAVAAYALSPIDIIPDFIPIIGLLDEALLLPLAFVGVLKLISGDIIAETRAIAARAAAQPVSWAAAGFIATFWGVAIVCTNMADVEMVRRAAPAIVYGMARPFAQGAEEGDLQASPHHQEEGSQDPFL